MINIFKNQGLEIQILDLKKWDSLPLSIKKISKQFIEEDQEGLLVSSAKIKLLLNEK